MARNCAPSLVPAGTIYPKRFVVKDSGDFTVAQATANQRVIGISQNGTHDAPGTTSNTYAAITGQALMIFGLGDVPVELEAGTGGWSAGDFLKSDANGKGVPIAGAGSNQHVGAVGLADCAEGEIGLVQILIYTMDPDEEADSNFGDDEPLYFGAGDDAGLMWSTADVSNNAFVLMLGDTNESLHITDVGARATDWNVNAETHPTVYIHSNTTPATNYAALGRHDGTSFWFDNVGNSKVKIAFDGLEALILSETASAINEVTITNAAISTAPSIAATGDDTNISLKLTAKGTGVIERTTACGLGGVGLGTPTTITTAGAATYTIAQLKTGLILRDPNGASRSDVTPTGTLFVAGMPGAAIGAAFEFIIKNDADAAEVITVTAGDGDCTLVGDMAIGQNELKRFLAVITSVVSHTYTLYAMGSVLHNT